jgi:hypothetical protein
MDDRTGDGCMNGKERTKRENKKEEKMRIRMIFKLRRAMKWEER